MLTGPMARSATPRKSEPRKPRRLRRALLLLALAFVVWLPAPAVLIWWHGTNDQARAADCIIVLGAAAYHTRPSPVFEERIRHAIALHERGLARYLLFTGGYGTGAEHAEASVARDFAIRHGIPDTAILTETRSRTTQENLIEARRVMNQHGLRSAVIVSDPFHLKRAAMIAHDLGLVAVTSPTPTSRFQSWRARLEFLARETWFYHRYLYTGG